MKRLRGSEDAPRLPGVELEYGDRREPFHRARTVRDATNGSVSQASARLLASKVFESSETFGLANHANGGFAAVSRE